MLILNFKCIFLSYKVVVLYQMIFEWFQWMKISYTCTYTRKYLCNDTDTCTVIDKCWGKEKYTIENDDSGVYFNKSLEFG